MTGGREYRTESFSLQPAFASDRTVTGYITGSHDASPHQLAFKCEGVSFDVWTTLEGIEVLSTSLAAFARGQRERLRAAA